MSTFLVSNTDGPVTWSPRLKSSLVGIELKLKLVKLSQKLPS